MDFHVALMDCICHMDDYLGISLLMIARGQPTGVLLNADIDYFTLCCHNFLCCINGDDVFCQEGEQFCLVGINSQELLPVSRQICRPVNSSSDTLATLVSGLGLQAG